MDQPLADVEEVNADLKGALTLNLFFGFWAENKTLKSLIDNVNLIDEKRFYEQDLFGCVYEYFLRIYAASGIKEVGEFYTPASAVQLIAELVESYSGTVYDPCCGSGGMFVQSMKFVEHYQGNRLDISVQGQESNPQTWHLCKMNLVIRGISHNLANEIHLLLPTVRIRTEKLIMLLQMSVIN